MEFIRIPATSNNSLKCWSAADEYLISSLSNYDINGKNILLLGDRFGYLTKNILSKGGIPLVYIDLKSQQEAISINCSDFVTFKSEDNIPNADLALINIPKSLSELSLFLYIISKSLGSKGQAIFGFLTRHFTPSYIKLISEYFDEINQSKAKKKARLIFANSLFQKEYKQLPYIDVKTSSGEVLNQYYGVFSEKNIDQATSFLIDHLNILSTEKRILDLGSGNGIIAKHINDNYDNKSIILLDNSFRAHLSGKINLDDINIEHLWNYNLSEIKDKSLDLIVSNPPFHFNFEVDLSIPFDLLRACAYKLKENGRLIIVANRHINYKSVIENYFNTIKIIAVNNKYYILEGIR